MAAKQRPQRSPEEQLQETMRKKFDEALNNPDVPQIYVNALQSGYNNTDFILLLESNGRPSVILNLSYTLAKTLVQNIGNNIADMETQMGHSIHTMEEMEHFRQNMPNSKTIIN